MKSTNSLHSTFLRYTLFITLTALGILVAVWVKAEFIAFQHESESLRQKFVNDQKIILKTQVAGVADYINYMGSRTSAQVKGGIRQRVNEAYKVAWNIYSQNHETSPPAVIQKMIRDALRPIRFNHNRGYYFAFNFDGVVELFADRPELEGTNILDAQKARGEYTASEMLALIKKQNEGFHTYNWTKPGLYEKKYPKISYVKLFEPYGWLLGTGEYFDDTQLDIQQEALERVTSLRFEGEGYFFGSTFAGDSLFSNGIITRGTGGNILDVTDPNGIKIIREQIRTVRESVDGGFVQYSWNKLGKTKPSPKLSYVIAIPEWQWVIGAGIYLDTIEQIIAQNRSELQKGLRNKIALSFIITLFLFFVIILWVGYLAKRIESNTETFTAFFKKAASGAVSIDENKLHYAEFRNIARSANLMLRERTETQKDLVESEQRHTSMFQDNHSNMLIIDSETGTIIDANPAACVFYGYERNAITSMNISDINILPPEQIMRKLENAKQNKRHYYIFQHRLANGEIRDVEVFTGSIQGYGKKVLFSIIHDITKRKQVEDALKSSEENLALVQKIASVGSWTWNVVKDQLIWSEEMYAICGVEKEDFHGGHEIYQAMVHPDDQGDFRRLTESTFDNNGKYNGSYRIIRPDGKVVYIYEQGVVNYDADGRPAQLFGTVQDITEKKRLEEELLQDQKMKAIGTLAGGIAHDFNNILTAILGYAEIARSDLPKNSPAVQHINQVLVSGQRAAELVRQILMFSRKNSQQKKPVRIEIIVKEALKMLRSSLPATLDIEEDIRSDTGLVLADPTSIHQIVINLCTNALHAMEDEKGIVSVSLYQRKISRKDIGIESAAGEGLFITLLVRDKGYGIGQEIIDRIFDPFFTTKEVGKGTGLGLSVIHGIVADCNGFIQVDSTPGKGTSFFVNLPVLAEHEEEVEPVIEKDPLSGTGHILFVDDEPLLVDLNTTFLERAGYTVTPETDSYAALEKFTADPTRFDLVITDQTMPGMTGAEMVQAMLEIRPELPVILCTGYSSILPEEKAVALGIKLYINKPVSRTVMLKLVQEALVEA